MFPDFARDDVFRLETRRLWLRWPQRNDAEHLTPLVGNKAVAEMTSRIPHPYPDGESARYIAGARDRNESGLGLALMMAFKEKPGAVIGAVSVARDRAGLPFMAYWVGQPFWGKGLATEAAQAMLDLVFTFTDSPEVGATARVINPASRRVLEKCGFTYVGSGLENLPARGGPASCDRFRLDQKVWSSLKGWRMPGLVRRPKLAVSDESAACLA
jgi:RimJ/RimL family protein N-acetyltransferase